MAKHTAPRHGSLGFLPKKRANRPYSSVSVWADSDEATLLGFAGYKAGMTHVIATDQKKTSPSFGQTISLPATILECPPMFVLGIRFYTLTPYGSRVLTHVLAENVDKRVRRKITLTKKSKEKKVDVEKIIGSVSEIRLLISTKPTFKKTPEVFEMKVGGDVTAAYEYAKEALGKDVRVSDILKEGVLVDAVAITKGKGIQGPVKRWGTKIQYRKAHGRRRHVGALNPWSPRRVMWTALQGGQMGYHKRTALNIQVLKVGEDGKDVNPAGGIPHFGIVTSDYVLLKGSVPGPKKRMVMMRLAVRPGQKEIALPELKRISLASQQGAGTGGGAA